ncbi:MAG: hypothetical protein IPK65_06915 [Gammaproteobacteria bacterium]|nr:hypothetical protein [Gammaproteobacteria bacterium]
MNALPCPVCGSHCAPLDVVDFNKSCAESWGTHLPLSGISLTITIFAADAAIATPRNGSTAPSGFRARIYNEEYIRVDPTTSRNAPSSNATGLDQHTIARRRIHSSLLDYAVAAAWAGARCCGRRAGTRTPRSDPIPILIAR